MIFVFRPYLSSGGYFIFLKMILLFQFHVYRLLNSFQKYYVLSQILCFMTFQPAPTFPACFMRFPAWSCRWGIPQRGVYFRGYEEPTDNCFVAARVLLSLWGMPK